MSNLGVSVSWVIDVIGGFASGQCFVIHSWCFIFCIPAHQFPYFTVRESGIVWLCFKLSATFDSEIAMTPEEILSFPARVLSQTQREHYFAHGYVGVESLIPCDTLTELQSVTKRFFEASRTVTQSNAIFDVAPEHTATDPILRRLKNPDERDSVYWRVATGMLADVAADLAGPNVLFHHSKLNFKWHDESDRVKWHQDIQFFPHTNYNVFTIGCYLGDTDMSNGPLAVLKDSHNDPLYDQYDTQGNWTGMLSDADAAALDRSRIEYLTGLAGSITIHNSRTLHFSPSSKSLVPRPLLLNCYTSADAKAYTPHPAPSSHAYELVRGEPVTWAHHDPRPCQIPPDWSRGYTSIYAAQSGEDNLESADTMR
ncbi:MAG: ectoine hydroxylase [Gammaproteobacteria bacterium]|jgi:ectoine hydroxylase